MTPKQDESAVPERIWIAPVAFLARSSSAVIYDESQREESDIAYLRKQSVIDRLKKKRDELSPVGFGAKICSELIAEFEKE